MLGKAIANTNRIDSSVLCMFGNILQDIIDVADCAISKEKKLSGVALNHLYFHK